MPGARRGLALVAENLGRLSSGEQVARYIKRLIFEGRLRTGDRVPQDEVATALGVSRIPVREGLIALEREGWVRIELHRGAFVVGLDEEAVRDHYAMFALVYGYAARRALDREPSAATLGAALGAICKELADADDPASVGHLTLQFHAVIVEAARSPRIKVVVDSMSGLVPGNFFAQVPGTIRVEKQGLNAIMRAMRRGDGERAAAEYDRMMRRHADLVVDLMTERGLFAAVG